MGQARRNRLHVQQVATHESTTPNPTKRTRKAVQPSEGRKHRSVHGHDDPLVFIGQLVNVFCHFPLMFEEADKETHRLDLEYGDLTHAIELAEVKKRDSSKVLAKLQENRRKRREAKDFIIKSEPLHAFIKSRKQMATDLIALHGQMTRLSESLGRRTYTPRTFGSMAEAMEKAGITTREAELLADGLAEIAAASEGGNDGQ